jgi:DNA-binding NarL/FixJ family response regulator
MEIQVAIFDDNESRRDGLEIMINLTEGMHCVGSFPDCSNVIADIDRTKPDIVLMDIDMPKVNGIEGVKLIRQKNTGIKILMQTVFEDDEKILSSICAGADGYILKKTPPHELIHGIIEAMNGGAPMTPVIARQVLRFLKKGNPELPASDFDLTQREHEILSLLVQGLSYKMIASKCNVSTATVNTHVQHIYEKLQVHSVVEAVTKAIAHKIV